MSRYKQNLFKIQEEYEILFQRRENDCFFGFIICHLKHVIILCSPLKLLALQFILPNKDL